MKKSAALLAALVTGALLRADEAPAAPALPAAPATSYSVSVDFPYVSSYVFRGVKIAEDSFQPSLKLAAGNAYAGIWYSQPFDSKFDNEIDFYGGYSFPLSGGWALDVGATYYYYPQLDTSTGADSGTFEGYLGLTGTVGGVTVGGYVYRDFTLEATTLQGSLGYGVPINDKLSANFALTLGYVVPDHGDEYTYYGAALSLPWKISDKATITVGANWATNDIDGAEDNLFWVNAGFTYAF
jgi:uncharacterized protein (TIGR02001 family)